MHNGCPVVRQTALASSELDQFGPLDNFRLFESNILKREFRSESDSLKNLYDSLIMRCPIVFRILYLE